MKIGTRYKIKPYFKRTTYLFLKFKIVTLDDLKLLLRHMLKYILMFIK